MGTTETEADLFFKQLAEASSRADQDGYLVENEPWMAAALVDVVDEEPFWR